MRSHTLIGMKTRIATARRVTWRHRFLEIAEQFGGEVRSPVNVSGLRPRTRMAGFATLRPPRAPGTRGA